MKKGYLYLMIAGIVVIAILVGVFLFRKTDEKNSLNTTNVVENKLIGQTPVENVQSIDISAEQEKLSPKASMVLKTHYKECGHTIKQYIVLPDKLINDTKEQVKQEYPDWEIEEFSPLELILIQEAEGLCKQHYMLKEKDGIIAIYTLDENGQETLKEQTDISTEYLTKTDLLRIQQGIKVYGEEQLNSALEDFE